MLFSCIMSINLILLSAELSPALMEGAARRVVSSGLDMAYTGDRTRWVSGGTWTSPTTGLHIQAHGAGVTEAGSTYYLIGENKLNGTSSQSIRCYSSTNLIDWTFVNLLLTQQSSGNLGPPHPVAR
ncbi:hypothetical protein L873DRAFT_1839676 [Choiromyces venosus 120613-1]|uniref:Arabinanase/levansucrase/invertase n=1 Tax=Choiromyces venosus 120613-1 TaxID=1336337 RepID=A0A3N4K8A3_9PEZI|nr:hypothetical protein L873DRAFT_1839676 [Choiromyces venosus 120613-1]